MVSSYGALLSPNPESWPPLVILLPAGRPGSVEFSESNQQAAES
eukprot:COSAG01_NODE_60259_length_295_cov_3.030612_1_plen_43_part_01